MEMERKGQNEKYRKESVGREMGKEGGIQDSSKASGLGIGLPDLTNKYAFNNIQYSGHIDQKVIP